MNMKAPAKGMSLLELMIAVAIVAILASIAIPSYSAYVRRSQRSDATSALLRLAAAQEKFYLQNNTYTNDESLLGGASSEHGWYTLEVTAADATSFSVTATPVSGGAQASDSHCSSFSIDHTGDRDATNTDCWR